MEGALPQRKAQKYKYVLLKLQVCDATTIYLNNR
jgi:hypothetical protein